jgi:hypothetical protein
MRAVASGSEKAGTVRVINLEAINHLVEVAV